MKRMFELINAINVLILYQKIFIYERLRWLMALEYDLVCSIETARVY